MSHKKGLIIKLIGGLYTVIEDNTKHVFLCKARGKFRHIDVNPKVGDHVLFNQIDERDGYIIEVMPRRNDLTRPYIANVDKAILVFSVKKPEFNTNLLDRFLALIEFNDIEAILLFSKMDLLNKNDLPYIEDYTDYYQKIGYKVHQTSIKNLDKSIILDEITNHICVISGQSGVGKSSLLNTIDIHLNIKTDEISEALGRGKHTTRHVELIPLNGGWVADTPGFGLLEFNDMTETDLSHSFKEFFEIGKNCRFKGCLHVSEPNCAVKQAVLDKVIKESRYKNYLSFLNEIKERIKFQY
jgi:ribosome biogenesis GTPase